MKNSSNRRSRRSPLRILVDYVHERKVYCEYATDLSVGGLFVETEATFPPGTVLELRFKLPGGERVHELEGEVTWRRELEQNGTLAAGMGVRFAEGLDAEASAQLDVLSRKDR